MSSAGSGSSFEGHGTRESAPLVAWRPLVVLVLVKLGLHLVSNGPLSYGYMSDELYYLDCANHLAWGYVDHPPLSIALLWAVRAGLGESQLALRLLPVLAGCAAVVVVGLMARELGGGRVAQTLAALATVVSPVYLAVAGFYSMNAFEPLLWALAAYVLLRLLNGADPRAWLVLGLVIGLGLLNKISMSWLAFGVGVGLLLTPQRHWLQTPWPWLAAAIAVLLFAPYLVWQVRHDWPTLEFMRNATRYKMVPKSPLDFLAAQLLVMNPLLAPLWMAGLAYYFGSRAGRPYRLVAWIWVTTCVLLMASSSVRSNYLAPAYVVLLPAGAVALARLASAGTRWLPGAAAVAMTAGGLAVAPMAIPLLPPPVFASYQRAIRVSPPRDQVDTLGELPLHFALRFGWEDMTQAVAQAYAALPPGERARAGILAQTFGEAGAIDFFGRARGLPPAVGTHNNYWLWGPGSYTGEVMIVLAAPGDAVLSLFEQVERVADVRCDYCMPMLRQQSVYVCRRMRQPLSELWPSLKTFE